MMKFLKKIFSLNFWIHIEGNSIYDIQEGEKEIEQQMNLFRFFNNSYSEQLKRIGNNPDIPREIFHFIHFKKNSDLENFTNQICENDFVVIEKFSINEGENTIGYKIMRIDKTDAKSVKEFTTFLCHTAYKNDSIYKGWETFPAN